VKKSLTVLLSSLVLLFSVAMPTFAADSPTMVPQPAPMTNEGSAANQMVVPQPAFSPQSYAQFLGQWTLDLYGGSRVDKNGTVVALPYSEVPITLQGMQPNDDGSMFFTGVVDNEAQSFVSAFYNPTVDKRYIEIYLYLPNIEFGMTSQFLQIQCSVWVAHSGDYMYGTMSAKQMGLGRDGTSWVPESSFINKVDIYRTPIQTAPIIGDAPAVGGTGSGGKG
jgi:hypothetical protein